MNTQLQNTTNKEQQLTLELLQVIDQKDDISQRHLAQQMGVALGLANSYLKRCVKKGFIKIKTAPANRYIYYLTPRGFSEKARLTSEFLSTSLALFRQSGDVYADLFAQCLESAQSKIIFAGISDLTDIAYMRSLQSEVDVVGVFHTEPATFFDLDVSDNIETLNRFDVVVMTSMEQTGELLEILHKSLSEHQIIVPSLLLNLSFRTNTERSEDL